MAVHGLEGRLLRALSQTQQKTHKPFRVALTTILKALSVSREEALAALKALGRDQHLILTPVKHGDDELWIVSIPECMQRVVSKGLVSGRTVSKRAWRIYFTLQRSERYQGQAISLDALLVKSKLTFSMGLFQQYVQELHEHKLVNYTPETNEASRLVFLEDKQRQSRNP